MKMKNKMTVRDVAVETLLQIEKNQAYSNLLLNSMIKKYQVNTKDISLLTEIVYGTLQRKDTLDYYLENFIKKTKKIDAWVRILLRISVYQMVYLDRVPERAIFFEAVEIAKKRGHKGISSFVNGVLRSLQREGLSDINQIADSVERLSIKTSHPKWLVEKWIDQYGYEETEKMCEANLTPPSQTARVNQTKMTVDELMKTLNQNGVSVEHGDLAVDAIKGTKGNLALTDAFSEGFLTIQDESSMLVARALNPQIGETILDACAAPGGKSTHIAERMGGTGTVHSLDLHEHKVKLIKQQAERLNLTNIQAEALDSRLAGDRFEKNKFDRILVDAPCSGFGVIRRKPDIKYTKSPEDVLKLAELQKNILHAVAPLLKSNGVLVYSTCTIDREENTDVIQSFLKHHPEFELDQGAIHHFPEKLHPYFKDGEVQLLPHYFGTDGFYIVCLRKKG
ncbi:16S rRNA (cytosine(967)-C(5))-methyltransferase RsmB [Metabacillus endolithicus]|uniref:16S rRNA (cytosine(967)-C(5))-methyltransferase n=1 Tax=Metabacillus endolithicus TaxID=1535204 RepID=A0ABW5BVN2_9BACI|nr:16S rRNA (cytosine(967)-C(5))-methyltransferase RsmB [Metabacillus endolithicus]UPG63218.1 16S rRNA (cytosine(967)-C(5))-methyltransferase RsmB [Metabacillus endolithicus]